MRRLGWQWPFILIGSAIAVGAVVFGDAISPIRPVVALWFLLVCPGMAFVPLLRIKDRASELILAIALSLAIDALLATIMIYTGLWSPKGGIGVLIGMSVIGALLQFFFASLRPSAEALDAQTHN